MPFDSLDFLSVLSGMVLKVKMDGPLRVSISLNSPSKASLSGDSLKTALPAVPYVHSIQPLPLSFHLNTSKKQLNTNAIRTNPPHLLRLPCCLGNSAINMSKEYREQTRAKSDRLNLSDLDILMHLTKTPTSVSPSLWRGVGVCRQRDLSW